MQPSEYKYFRNIKVVLRSQAEGESNQQSGHILFFKKQKRRSQFFCVCAHVVSSRCVSDIDQTVRIVLHSLIFLLSVLGNGLIIAVLVRNRRMRTVTNLFLLSLSVSDLMVSLVCIPFTLIPNLMRDFVFGTGMCKLVMYFMGE